MVRILPGDSWKLNPGYRSGLEELGRRATSRFSPGSILDVLGIEVDGVNISQGLSETAIFAVLEELAGVVLRLCREPQGSGQVSLGEGRTELVLGRHGSRAALSVISLARPARLLAGELEVDLASLALAVGDSVGALLCDLRELAPGVEALPFARRLSRRAAALRKAARLAGAPAAEPAGSPPLARRPAAEGAAGGLSLAFELRDEHGRLDAFRAGADLYSLLVPGQTFLCDAAGTELLLASTPPFLLLSDLARCSGELVAAIHDREPRFRCPLGAGATLEVDLAAGLVRLRDRELACAPLALARAFLEGALAFASALIARNPAQAENAYLGSLADGAREGLAHLRQVEGGDLFDDREAPRPPAASRKAAEPPLGKGTLKRLRFRVAWSGTDTGERAREIRLGKTLLVLGRRGAAWVDARSGALLTQRGGESAVLSGGGALLADRNRLTAFSASGEAIFLRDQPGHDQPALTGAAGLLRVGPDRQPATLCLFEGRIAAAILLATGRAAWQLRVPQAVRLSAVVAGERAFVASDTGFLYALEPVAGQVVFRVRTGVSFEGPLTAGAQTVASLGRGEGGLTLCAVDALTGRPRFSLPLGLRRAGAPLHWRQKLLVAGQGEAGSTVVGFGPAGRETFRTPLDSQAGVPALTVHRGRIYCGLRDGSVACLGPGGERLWSAPPCGLELDLPLAPIVRRDVLVAAGDPIRALDPQTGRVLATLPPTQGLSAFAVGRGLDVYAVDDDGVAARFDLATHLSVV